MWSNGFSATVIPDIGAACHGADDEAGSMGPLDLPS